MTDAPSDIDAANAEALVDAPTEIAAVTRPALPRLVFLVTEDWYFWAHRLPQARAAQAAGFEVHVACRVDRHGSRIQGEGFIVHPLSWRRGSIAPWQAGEAVAEIANLYRALKPDLVHHVSQKPILFGSAAARIAGVRHIVNAFTGLGLLFAANDAKSRALRTAIGAMLRVLAGRSGTRVLVENPDDRDLLVQKRILPARRITVIRGSGIDLSHYPVLPEPSETDAIGVAARLLKIKGIDLAVAAQKLLRERGVHSRLLIAGAIDPESAASFTEADLARWREVPGVELLGQLDDVRSLWRRASIALLPSLGGEGIPMSLLEAAACGRPLVATDVPGCREIVRNGVNGVLVQPGDPAAVAVQLADALQALLPNRDRRVEMGIASRELVESDLSAEAVGAATVAVYRSLLADGA